MALSVDAAPHVVTRRIAARISVVLLFAWTLAVTVYRTIRRPNDYAEAQWLLDWQHGFVKRGLMGTLLHAATSAAHVSITPTVIAIVAWTIFSIFAAVMVTLAARIASRTGWSPGPVIAGLVFLSSPFWVMQTDVVGYFDALVIIAAAGAAWLVLRGRPWLAAGVQVVALLVHEQSLVLGLPLAALATVLRARSSARGTVRWHEWIALGVPALAFVLLAVVWQHTTTSERVALYATRIRSAGFIGENRDIWAPEWIFRSFADSWRAESPLLWTRLTDVNMLRIVTPSVLTLLCVAVETFALPIFSIELLAIAVVCLAPQAMHLVAWDTPRIWTYSSVAAFMALWVCSEVCPQQRAAPAAVLVGTWALVAHAFARTPLLDVPFETFRPIWRTLAYLPAIAGALLIASRAGRSAIMPLPMDRVPAQPSQSTPAMRIALVVGVLLFVTAVLRSAWLGDDAYITFRSVDNLIHGYGLRWNVVERVQAFTHPLWALLLAGPFAITGETYFTALAISIALAFAAVGIFMFRIADTERGALLGIAAFVFSKAFGEYATSGLENPLTSFLLALFLAVYWSRSQHRLWGMWPVAGLLMLDRLDTVLLVLPALAFELRSYPVRRTIVAAAVGLSPLLAWEVFSVIYYGFPFPNTAYAKLQTGIGGGELFAQGLLYLLDSMSTDPVTLLVITAGALSTWLAPRRGDLPIVAGILLYVVYIVRIGGDFMSGRFLVAPLLCATALLARRDWAAWAPALAPLVAVCAVLGTLATVRPPILSTTQTFVTRDADGMGVGGVADERAFYFRMSGLLRWTREQPLPADPLMVSEGRRLRGSGEVVVTRNVGFFGYFAGPTVHIVDLMALGDPLLARLPAIRPWRIGHFERRLPDGYVESIRSGTNRIADYDTAAKYEQLKLVTQGALWTARRWRAIRRMNLGW